MEGEGLEAKLHEANELFVLEDYESALSSFSDVIRKGKDRTALNRPGSIVRFPVSFSISIRCQMR